MPFASSPVRDALEGYVTGRVNAERLVVAIATEYYGREGKPGTRDGLQPLIEVIDRASPGIVELGSVSGGAGFDVRLAARPFPRECEPELRRAAQAYLGEPPPDLLSRLIRAARRLFTAST